MYRVNIGISSRCLISTQKCMLFSLARYIAFLSNVIFSLYLERLRPITAILRRSLVHEETRAAIPRNNFERLMETISSLPFAINKVENDLSK